MILSNMGDIHYTYAMFSKKIFGSSQLILSLILSFLHICRLVFLKFEDEEEMLGQVRFFYKKTDSLNWDLSLESGWDKDYCCVSFLRINKMTTQIHSFSKQCLRNLHFMKTGYISRNLSIKCSVQVPYFDKLKFVHNTAYKMNSL